MKDIIRIFFLIALITFNCAKMPDKFVILPPINGLVAYYPFNGNAKDESGNNYNGAVHGASLTSDRFGHKDQAYKFDGIDDYIDCGDILNNLNLPLTISAWINIQGYNQTNFHILFSDLNLPYDPASHIYYGIVFYGNFIASNGVDIYSEPKLAFMYGDGTGKGLQARRSKDSNTILSKSQWIHVACVARGAQDMDLYINGENAGGAYSGSGGSMAHNSWRAYIGYLFNGYIDELCVFNRALDQNEIMQLASSTN